MHSEREEGAVTGCLPSQDADPCLGAGHSVKASPFLGIYSLFIGDEKRSPCMGRTAPPAPPPSLPGHSTSSLLFLCHCDSGAGRIAEGPGETRAEERGGHGGGLGPTGAPQDPLLPTTSDDGCK